MTRRITLAILATVAVALLLAGVGTLLLTRADARRQSLEEVRQQAQTAADTFSLDRVQLLRALRARERNPDPDARFTLLEESQDVQDVAVVAVDADDQLVDAGEPLPLGLTTEDIDVPAVRAGEVTSGRVGGRVWAAASVSDQAEGLIGIAVISRTVDPVTATTLRWIVVTSAGTLVLAALVASRLGRRIGRPLEAATAATTRIAGGDLAARVPPPRAHATGGDELDELAGAINAMAEALERSRGLERQFLLSVSHDLRTPLTAIRGWAEAIADGAAPDASAAAATIGVEAGRLDRLVRDLLQLARLDARQFTFHLASVDLCDVARRGAAAARPAAAAAGVDTSATTPGQAVAVVADADRLPQVLGNLVDNAVRHARSRVEVVVVDDPVSPRLEVHDDGPGIATEDLPHVFERLYVARATPRDAESGSGLGLAIVRELAEGMGGTVAAAAASHLGGARLVVTLRPAGPAADHPGQAGPETSGSASTTTGT